MNITPRKCLCYLTPNEAYEKLLNGSYTSYVLHFNYDFRCKSYRI